MKDKGKKFAENPTEEEAFTLLWNGYDGKKLEYSFLVVFYPKKNKSILYFVNPITAFPGKTEILENTSGKEIFAYSASELEKITSHKISYYINLSSENLIKLIDLLGGLPFYLDPNVHRIPGKYARKEGDFLLFGEEAVDLFFLPAKPEPINYIQRLNLQQSILLSLLDKLSFLGGELHQELIQYLYFLAETNLPREKFEWFIKKISGGKVFYTVFEASGELKTSQNGRTYLSLMTDQSRVGFHEMESLLFKDEESLGENARVEILNGTEVNGLAKKTKDLLNAHSIKVLSTENAWKSGIKRSIILDRSGKAGYSRRLAEILGIKKIKHLIRKESGLDVTILLGEDIESKTGKVK
ncbi:MAG: LytR C-terminal domain-containing protein [Leptospiraceae bacterium]|nr:LytR C-terminal domain-containing protein [Leptospiraceae bacterium]MCP5499759.1 LytR C-terminal domain-containing protein [Leptospiraceae bacterium]